METIRQLFGEGHELSTIQMCCRAVVVFFLTLFMIRIAGMRTFGKKSAFDNIVVIMLGAILSRAITGASPFFPTVFASLVFVLIHRILAWCSMYNSTLSRIIKGERKWLYRNGEINRKNMKHSFLSDAELLESVRMELNENSFDGIAEIYMESSGKLTVVKKKPETESRNRQNQREMHQGSNTA